VVKPDASLGEGRKSLGLHLSSVSEGVAYAKELFEAGHSNVVIEEKLDGENSPAVIL